MLKRSTTAVVVLTGPLSVVLALARGGRREGIGGRTRTMPRATLSPRSLGQDYGAHTQATGGKKIRGAALRQGRFEDTASESSDDPDVSRRRETSGSGLAPLGLDPGLDWRQNNNITYAAHHLNASPRSISPSTKHRISVIDDTTTDTDDTTTDTSAVGDRLRRYGHAPGGEGRRHGIRHAAKGDATRLAGVSRPAARQLGLSEAGDNRKKRREKELLKQREERERGAGGRKVNGDDFSERRRRRIFDKLAVPVSKGPEPLTLHEAVGNHQFRSSSPAKVARGAALRQAALSPSSAGRARTRSGSRSASPPRAPTAARVRSRERSPLRLDRPPDAHYQPRSDGQRAQGHRSRSAERLRGWRAARRLSEISDNLGELWARRNRFRYGEIDEEREGCAKNSTSSEQQWRQRQPLRCGYGCKATARCCCRHVDACSSVFFGAVAALVILGYVHVYPQLPKLFFLGLECSVELSVLAVAIKGCSNVVSRRNVLYACLATTWLTVLLLLGVEMLSASGALRVIYSLDTACDACFTDGLCTDTCFEATSALLLLQNGTGRAAICGSVGGDNEAADVATSSWLSGGAVLVDEEIIEAGNELLVTNGACNDGGSFDATSLIAHAQGGDDAASAAVASGNVSSTASSLTPTQRWVIALLQDYFGPAALGCCGYGSDCADCGTRSVPLSWDSYPYTHDCSCMGRQLVQAIVREGLLEEALKFTVIWSIHAKQFIVDPRSLLVLALCVACTFALMENLLSFGAKAVTMGETAGPTVVAVGGMLTRVVLVVPLHVSTGTIMAAMLADNRFRRRLLPQSRTLRPFGAGAPPYTVAEILGLPVVIHAGFALLLLSPPDSDGEVLGAIPHDSVLSVAAGLVGASCMIAFGFYARLDNVPRIDRPLRHEDHMDCLECVADNLGGCCCHCWSTQLAGAASRLEAGERGWRGGDDYDGEFPEEIKAWHRDAER